MHPLWKDGAIALATQALQRRPAARQSGGFATRRRCRTAGLAPALRPQACERSKCWFTNARPDIVITGQFSGEQHGRQQKAVPKDRRSTRAATGVGGAMSGFIAEAKRRSVIRVAGLYLTGIWLLLQIADTVLPMLDAPGWIARTLLIVLLIGFVPALVMAWVFEWTPGGLVRDGGASIDVAASVRAGKRLDRWIMVLLALALGYFAVDKFVLAPSREASVVQQARREGHSEAIKETFGERSIAVLPFKDMSAAQDQRYLADGISEELLNLLARVPELRVISRTSAFAFRDGKLDVPTIARKLDVGYILDGAIRKAGNRVRITVQLVDGRSDTQVWNDTYDRPLEDVFAIQDEIGAAVVAQLKIKMIDKDRLKVVRTDPHAYELYLKALVISRRETAESYEQAIALLKQALNIDPNLVGCWNLLGIIYSAQGGLGLIPSEDGYRLATEVAGKSLALDPQNTYALAQLAQVSFRRDNDIVSAASQIQRALEQTRDNAYMLGIADDITMSLGQLEEAIAINQHIVELDPMIPNAYSQLCLAYLRGGQQDEAISSCGTALEMDPGLSTVHYFVGSSLLLKGDPKAALAEMQKEPFEAFGLIGEAMAYHSLGQHGQSDAVLAQIIAKYEKDAAFNIAYIEAWRGNADSAFKWLDKAVQYNDAGLPMILAEPMLASIQSDPRWLPFLRKVGRAPEQLSAIRFEVRLSPSGAGKTQESAKY